MAWYYGKYSCGCEGRTQVYGPTKDRQRIADYRFEGLCPDCWQKQQEEKRTKENAEAAEKSAADRMAAVKAAKRELGMTDTTTKTDKKIYNKSIIMKRAWELNKQAAGTAVTFSDCLKTSWLQAKVEAGVITMEEAKKTMIATGLYHKGERKEDATVEIKKETETKKEETAKTEKEIIIEKLEAIAAAKNSYDNSYHYEVIVVDWAKYGKDRTYLKLEETRDCSKHNKITEYGWYDNIDKKYIPAKYADINSDFAKI